MTHEDYVTFEQAQALKELGFDWECNHYYHLYDELSTLSTLPEFENSNKFDKNWSAPTLAQARKWLFKTYDVSIEPYSKKHCSEWWVAVNFINDPDCTTSMGCDDIDSYEEALSEGINYALYMILNSTDKKRDKRILRSKYESNDVERYECSPSKFIICPDCGETLSHYETNVINDENESN